MCALISAAQIQIAFFVSTLVLRAVSLASVQEQKQAHFAMCGDLFEFSLLKQPAKHPVEPAAVREALAQIKFLTDLEVEQVFEQLKSGVSAHSDILNFKYSEYLTNQTVKEHHHLTTYTSYWIDRARVVQVVPKLQDSTPLEEKRRLLFICALNSALRRSGVPTLLQGFIPGEESRLRFGIDYRMHDFNFERVAFVLVSDKLSWAANLKIDLGAPNLLKDWSRRKAHAAVGVLTRLEAALRSWSVTGDNLQYLLSESGELFLTQLTRLHLAGPTDPPVDLESDRTLFKSMWQQARHQKF